MTEQTPDLEMSGPVPGKAPSPPINLYAKATRNNGGVDWAIGFQNPPAAGSKARVDLAPDSGEHSIIINLVATHGLDIDFNTADPVWACDGQQCPPPRGITTDQISVRSCTKSVLTLIDSNDGEPRIITYQLNFVGADPLDPEIKNGGITI